MSYDDSVILVCSPPRQTVISGSLSLVSGKYTLTAVYLFIYLFIYLLFIHSFVYSLSRLSATISQLTSQLSFPP